MLPLVIQIERTVEHNADTCAFAQSPVRIGRSPLADLQLDESFVSQFHGVIRFDEARTSYLDLGSTNPTLVNGEPIARNVEIEITEETDIRIGSLRLHVLRVDAPPELFGARRKSSFASEPVRSGGSVAATVMFKQGPLSPELVNALAPTQMRGVSASVRPASNAPAFAGHNAQASRPLSSGPPTRPALEAQPGRPASSLPPPAAIPSVRPFPSVAPAASQPPQGLPQLYEAYRTSRARWLAELRHTLERESAASRQVVFERLVRDYPELAHEPELHALVGKLQVSALSAGVPDLKDWLRRLTNGLYPPPGHELNLALVMERMGQILEVFSAAFVGLRVAHEQFCNEMSLEEHPDDSLLYSTKSPQAVLAYLLNPDVSGGSKVTELSRAMADFSVHQVALVSAVVEGARDMLGELSPAALTNHKDKPGASFLGKLLGNDQRQLWSRYLGTYDELVDEDRFTRKLFGRAFSRKYYAITGGRASVAPPPPAAARGGS